MLVLACHAELPFAQGGFVGLDVFFVLSGYLITRLVFTELQRTGSVSIQRFYARRARRLLPLSLTVLAAIVVGSLLCFSPVRSDAVSGDVVAAGLYFVNWRFIAQAVDYFAFNPDASPVRHYWSLSLEEQYYLVWPVWMLVSTWWVRRRGGDVRRALLIATAPLLVGSLLYGIAYTAHDAQRAYFSTLARGWELALGAALGLALPAGVRLARPLGALLAGGALATLSATTLLWGDATPYPSWRALVPCVAAAAFILAGTAERPSAPIRLLSCRPFQFLGEISYAWYLWHWPAIVFATYAWGRLSPLASVAVILASFAPTYVTHHAIEERFRRSPTLARRPRRALGLGFACTACAVALGLVLTGVQPTVPLAPASEVSGAMAVAQGATLQRSASALRPPPRDAQDDKGRMFADGCLTERTRETSRTCIYGDRSAPTTVVLFGDSHTLQYSPAILLLARAHRWRVVGLMRAGCPVADIDYLDGCDAWRRNTMRRILHRAHPDLVITSSSTAARIRVRKPGGGRYSRAESEPLMEAGYARTLRRLKRTGARIAVIRDQVEAPFNPAECVSEHLHDLRRCAFPVTRKRSLSFDARGARKVKGVRVIDPLPILCPHRVCPSVVGNALVYRNAFHLSATYARTLVQWLDAKLPKPRGVRS